MLILEGGCWSRYEIKHDIENPQPPLFIVEQESRKCFAKFGLDGAGVSELSEKVTLCVLPFQRRWDLKTSPMLRVDWGLVDPHEISEQHR